MDQVTGDYGWTEGTPCSSDYVTQAVVEILKHNGASEVLDAGCGNGVLVGELSKHGYKAYGIDADSGGIEIARKSFPQAKFTRFLFSEDPGNLPFSEDGRFDAVVSTEVIEHLYAPHELPQFAHRALRDGGIFIISTPYHGYLKNLALSLIGKWDDHFTANWFGGHIKFWSRKTLAKLLAEAGFDVTGFVGVGRAPWFWKSMILIARKSDASKNCMLCA